MFGISVDHKLSSKAYITIQQYALYIFMNIENSHRTLCVLMKLPKVKATAMNILVFFVRKITKLSSEYFFQL